jgi:hypothetical protein
MSGGLRGRLLKLAGNIDDHKIGEMDPFIEEVADRIHDLRPRPSFELSKPDGYTRG